MEIFTAVFIVNGMPVRRTIYCFYTNMPEPIQVIME